jgi:hypothetical protein
LHEKGAEKHSGNDPDSSSSLGTIWSVAAVAAQQKLGLFSSGELGLILLIVVVLLLVGRIQFTGI